MSEMTNRFKVGDRVTWCGVLGIVQDFTPSIREPLPMPVDFMLRGADGGPVRRRYYFSEDGRFDVEFHGIPMLQPYVGEWLC